MPKLVLRADKIDSLPFPEKGKEYYFDLKQPGLCLVVNLKGKSFYWIKQHKGVSYRTMLGQYPALRLDDARGAVAEAMASLARGEKPRIAMESMTLGQLWEKYSKIAKREQKSWKNTLDYYTRHIQKYWESKIIRLIEQTDVQEWLYSIGETSGKHTANRAFIVLQAAINWGLQNKILSLETSPVKQIKTYKLESRDRFLYGSEYDRFMAEVEKASPNMRDFIKICLFTGARKSNVLALKWSDINWELAYWRIDGKHYKNGETQYIHLSQMALEVLRKRPRESEWVFPSKNASSGHMSFPQKSFQRIAKRANVQNVRIHDLRRTFASHLAIKSKGNVQLTVSKALGQRDLRSSAIYMQLPPAHVREAVEGVFSSH
ncbi:MAG: site-specific integrase [Candidatus Obscuribacterales bacterium]|nr:site-specific integrase [Candidatus Obscuribacterales bacterium]